MTTRTQSFNPRLTAEVFNARSRGHLPGLVGLEIVKISADAVDSRLPARPELMAPNGFLHAAAVIALADTSCGYGCVAHLPEGASGFTTVELKANFLGTVREGGGGMVALFRCTQMVLWPRPGKLPNPVCV